LQQRFDSIQAAHHQLIVASVKAEKDFSLNKARAAIDRVLGRIAAPNIPAEISPAP
jgi:hypothetical protein